MSLLDKTKTTSQIEDTAKKVYWELIWGKRDEKGEYHAMPKAEYDEKSAFYHSKQWVSIEDVYSKLSGFREDELFRVSSEIDNGCFKTQQQLLTEIINIFDKEFQWEKQPILIISKQEAEKT